MHGQRDGEKCVRRQLDERGNKLKRGTPRHRKMRPLASWWDAGIADYTIQIGSNSIRFTDPDFRPAVPTKNERWFIVGGPPETGCLYEDFPIEPFLRLGEVRRGEPKWGTKLRFEILTRDGYRCRYCGRGAPEVSLEVDHVQPRSRGGSNHHFNLVTACFECNHGKKARYAPHPITMPRPKSRLNDDQAYICELLDGAQWRSLWRREKQHDIEATLDDQGAYLDDLEQSTEFTDGDY